MTRLTHGTILALGEYRVRCAPHWGHERSPTPTVFEILDAHGNVAARQLSCPSADDCSRALRAAQQSTLPASTATKARLGRGRSRK